MKQAIEEGFILDVLKNFMPVSVYYKVGKKILDNPEFDKGDAKRAINKFFSLNEHNIRQKVETIVDDFVDNRSDSNLPNIFEKNEFKLLIVAEKYQTGFDQPKLCAMYVDKKLDSVKTVQTLSRLNRTYPNKQTFVLDFQNSVEDIQDAYKPYFEMNNIDKVTDPNVVNNLWYQLYEYWIHTDDEINEFTILFYKQKRTSSQDSKMNSLIDNSVERYYYLEEEDEKRADEFKKKCQK